jgi:glucose/arabinose dehydrogenase
LAIYYGDMFSKWHGDLLVPALAGKHVARLRFYRNEQAPAASPVTPSNGRSNSYNLQQEERLFTELNQRIRDIRVHPRTGALYLLTESANGTLIKITRN